MQTIRSIAGTVCLFMVYVSVRMAWGHIANHDGKLVTKVVADALFAAVFAFCAYSMFTWGKRHPPKEG